MYDKGGRGEHFGQRNVEKMANMDWQQWNYRCFSLKHDNLTDIQYVTPYGTDVYFVLVFDIGFEIVEYKHPLVQVYGTQNDNAILLWNPANELEKRYVKPCVSTINRTELSQNTKQYCIQNKNDLKLADSCRKPKCRIVSSDNCNPNSKEQDNEAYNNSHEYQNTAISVEELEMSNIQLLDEHQDQPPTTSAAHCFNENENSIFYDRQGHTKSSDDALIDKIKELTSDFLTEDPQTCTVEVENLETTTCYQELRINGVSDASSVTEHRLVEGRETHIIIDCDRLKTVSNDSKSTTERQIEGTVNIGTRSRSSLPETIQYPDVRNSYLTDSNDINIRAVKQHSNDTLEDHLPLDVNDSRVLSNDSVPRTLYRNSEVPQNGSRSTDCDHDYNASKLKQQSVSAGLTCSVVHLHEQNPDQPAILKDAIKKLSNDTERVVVPRDWVVLPAVQNDIEELRRIVDKTVQGEPVPAQESMRFELLRSCTYRTFPKDGKPDVRKLAEAGFYYASNSDEVICYCCYKRISNWKADDDPMAIHRRISPECRFFTDTATVNVTKERTAQVESEIMAKIQGGRQRNTITQSAPFQTRKDSQSPRNIADAGVSLRQSQPARAHGQFAMAHSGETSLPMHQPPVNTRDSTKYLSMMPQIARNETASPNRSHFQTGVFVPQDNFRVPVIDTRAVQPSDDTPGQDAVIDEHVRESLFRIEEVSTSVATSSARAETSRPTTERPERGLDSLIRSDASVLVQGMGYELPIVRRALINLLDRGQTRPDAQEIMNEIFQIEDGTTN
ncbi:uncharacterized protein LOC127834472 [Dreissena polymorpha]|uniref:Uncharacterized protein n=1 Tax=Dreissena polymorpha TaxID=45954 RepID=A0A9D4FVL1_DREPO|nr:uncharacterized protein LOC127834472 [Dreissena polymorpha]XP_052216297.1 uncharacterized protein LOC127834472 [Dreissena polymorpha]KAH3803891.1 hypothetical protein DPMN_132161 [Dreissena polymorpha]